jgi:hypothetical protein
MRWIGLHVLVCMAFGATPDQARRRLQAFRPAASRRLNSHPDRLPGKYLLIDTGFAEFFVYYGVVSPKLVERYPSPTQRQMFGTPTPLSLRDSCREQRECRKMVAPVIFRVSVPEGKPGKAVKFHFPACIRGNGTCPKKRG